MGCLEFTLGFYFQNVFSPISSILSNFTIEILDWRFCECGMLLHYCCIIFLYMTYYPQLQNLKSWGYRLGFFVVEYLHPLSRCLSITPRKIANMSCRGLSSQPVFMLSPLPLTLVDGIGGSLVKPTGVRIYALFLWGGFRAILSRSFSVTSFRLVIGVCLHQCHDLLSFRQKTTDSPPYFF